MRFTKIKSTDKGVALEWVKKKAEGEEVASKLTSPQPPAPELPSSLAAFKPYVMELLDLPESWREDLIVTQLSISEQGDENLRGLIVTARRRIEKANGRPVVFNTPFMPEAGENTSENIATLDDATIALIEAAEDAAAGYLNGDRSQAELFTAKETTAAAPEKTNGTDPAAAPKVRRQRRVKEIEGAGRVMNPEATVPPTDEQIRKQLQISGLDVPVAVIATWTSSEREEALRYANDPDGIATPEHVKKGASLDAWTDPKPVRVGDNQKQEIMAAVEAAD
jgi:hypothetical protein